jgi:hypothetical protein
MLFSAVLLAIACSTAFSGSLAVCKHADGSRNIELPLLGIGCHQLSGDECSSPFDSSPPCSDDLVKSAQASTRVQPDQLGSQTLAFVPVFAYCPLDSEPSASLSAPPSYAVASMRPPNAPLRALSKIVLLV